MQQIAVDIELSAIIFKNYVKPLHPIYREFQFSMMMMMVMIAGTENETVLDEQILKKSLLNDI